MPTASKFSEEMLTASKFSEIEEMLGSSVGHSDVQYMQYIQYIRKNADQAIHES